MGGFNKTYIGKFKRTRMFEDEFDTDEEIEDDTLHEDSTKAMPVIENMESYMVSVYPFEECQDSIGIDD